jgi:hypothetical protein
MVEINDYINSSPFVKVIKALGLPWNKFLDQVWANGPNLLRGLSPKRLYTVIDYETTLELHDRQGERASVRKYERVRYLQDNVVAFQDQAWGEGKILLNYRCTPGVPVDHYCSSYKNIILISRREVKNRGDEDEYHIQWGIRRGFIKTGGFWATEISHPTKQISVQVIFPSGRPPLHVSILEKNRQHTTVLGKDVINRLPNNKWSLCWKLNTPRLYEQYILSWVW